MKPTPCIAPDSVPAFPDWWAHGVGVVGTDGQSGVLIKDPAGRWWVDRYRDGNPVGYVANPNPGYWARRPAVSVDKDTVARIAYEAACALYEAHGVGGVTHWTSVPESIRVGNLLLAPNVPARPELDGLRVVVMAAVRTALEPFTK